MINIFESYKKPDELIPLIENRDYNNINTYYYFKTHDLFIVLCSNIMDRFLTDKWWGRLDIRNTLIEFSTSYHVYEDKFENYIKPEKINHLWKQIFQAQKINYVHLVQI